MDDKTTLPSPTTRVVISFIVPVIGAVLLGIVITLLFGGSATIIPGGPAGAAVFFAAVGAASWFLGLRWYGLAGLGLRGGRPLYAGIGFATLGWVVFFVARLFLVSSDTQFLAMADFGRAFIYLFMFEAFAAQLWIFGLLFRSIADWRGPLTAAITSGILFGGVASLFFAEAFIDSFTSLLYFMVWGVFYGLIRLRTGSILGTVIVQAMQSLTGWSVLLPEPVPDIQQLQTLYLVTSIFYSIFIWRLWPQEEADYRV